MTCIFARFHNSSPPGGSALLLDLAFLFALAVATMSIVWLCLRTKTHHESFVALALITGFGVLIRSIPNLRLSFPPLHDPYYYFVGSINITEYGTISPELSGWFSNLALHLKWPLLQLISAMGIESSGLEGFFMLRFLNPLLSVLLPLSVFLLGRHVFNSIRIGLVAAMLATSLDACVFYQSEFHPQGVAISLLALLIFAMFRFASSKKTPMAIALLLLTSAIILSHHFSSLFLALVGALLILLVSVTWRLLRNNDGAAKRGPFSRPIMQPLRVSLVLIAVLCAAYDILVGYQAVREFFSSLMTSSPPSLLLAAGSGVPLFVTLFGSYKWVMLLISIPAVIHVIKSRDEVQISTLLLLITIVASIGIGNFITGGPTDRLIAFCFTIVAVFAARTLLKERQTRWRAKRLARVGLACAISCLSIFSVLNAQIPAFYFDSAGQNGYFWYSNDISSIQHYGDAGSWINESGLQKETFFVEFDTYVIPFYYSHVPLERIRQAAPDTHPLGGVTLVNPGVDFSIAGRHSLNESQFSGDSSYDLTFDDGEIWIMINAIGD